mmetsp:Transcript_35593/g.101374  ORF Transcript_35593/g.101374 Transcript_35593/m.101374 type:complete len:210 (+) Transcript_35593:127-756(+)
MKEWLACLNVFDNFGNFVQLLLGFPFVAALPAEFVHGAQNDLLETRPNLVNGSNIDINHGSDHETTRRNEVRKHTNLIAMLAEAFESTSFEFWVCHFSLFREESSPHQTLSMCHDHALGDLRKISANMGHLLSQLGDVSQPVGHFLQNFSGGHESANRRSCICVGLHHRAAGLAKLVATLFENGSSDWVDSTTNGLSKCDSIRVQVQGL